MFELAWPWLFALLPLPFITAWLLPRARGWSGAMLHLPHLGLALPQQRDVSPVPFARRAFALLAWVLLMVAGTLLGPDKAKPRPEAGF